MTPVCLIGTDTGVGKTQVCLLLAQGLRSLGRRVWLHKPVACGDWDGVSAEDGRRLRAACGDGQDPATICPREFPEACSPHLAAQAAGCEIEMPGVMAAIPAAPDLLLLETAGGLLAPLTTRRETNADLLAALGWPVLLVTRPHLGTLNHTCLTVQAARRCGLRLLGMVVNHHARVPDSLAIRTVADELHALTGLAILAEIPSGATEGRPMAQALLASIA